MQRVVIVVNSLGTGGTERSLAEMLPRYRAHGIDPVVTCFYRREEGIERNVTLAGHDVRFLSSTSPIDRIRELRALFKTLEPSVVHTSLFAADVIGRIAATGIAPVLTSLVNVSYDAARLEDPNIRRARLRVLQEIDGATARHLTAHFHAVTSPVKRAAMAALRVPAERITVIERGRNPGRLGEPSADRRRRVRSGLGVGDGERVFINVGREEFQKGHTHLIRAFARVNAVLPSRLVIAGRRGVSSRELDMLVRELHLEERVLRLGHRDDVPDLLAASDVFVFPSIYEGMGGAAVEAMALALPIVTTPTMADVVEADRNAILVPAAAVEPLAEAMRALALNPTRARAFGRRSEEIFRERYVLERSVERMCDLYARTANMPAARAFGSPGRSFLRLLDRSSGNR